MAASSVNKIERAHQMYRDGQHEEALGFYTEALSMAKTKAQKIALHSNRAACFLKLHDFKKAAEECTLVLELDQKHAGALMLRAQTLVTLREYHSALFDVNRLMELNPSSDVYHNLQARLKTQLSLAPIPESEEESLVGEMEDLEELRAGGGGGQEEEEDEQEEEEDEDEQEEEEDEDEQEDDDKEVVEKQMVEEEKRVIEEKEKQLVEGSGADQEKVSIRTVPNPVVPAAQTQNLKDLDSTHSKGWKAISKPKGHSNLDYSRWDRVEDDSSDDDEDDEDEESQPQYRFRVRTVGVRPVK